MRYGKISVLFWALMPLSVVLRLLQLIFTVDTKTGFFLREYENMGNIMLIATFIFAFAAAVFPFFSHRNPEHPPKINIFLTVTSVALAFSVLLELFTETFPITVQWWLILALRVTGLASAAFFALFGMGGIVDIKIPNICSVIPVIYFIIRVICDFTAISALALISDNLILMASYCSCLWFMLNFAKLYNGIDTERNFKKLMSSAMLAVIFCFTQSIPHIVMNFATNNAYLHTSFQVNLNILLMGIFILTFMLSHFSRHNACEN